MSRRQNSRRPRGFEVKPLNPTQKQQVKDIIKVRQELKFFPASKSGVAVSTTPTIDDLSAIPQGSTDNDRDGDRVRLETLELRGVLINADVTNHYRIVVFSWFPNSTPVAGNILLNGPSGNVDAFSCYSHDNRQLYKILWDKFYFCAGNGGAASNPYTPTSEQPLYFRVPVTPKQVQFAAGTTNGTNKVYILYLSDSGAISHPVIHYATKLLYTDS